MKLGTQQGGGLLRLFMNWQVLSGLALYGLSAILWIMAISKVQLTFAYPMVALGYVIVFAASYFIFGDDLNAWKISGLAFIIIGVVLVSRS
jgi:drug/metabolite transporter (DMT)-like permease